MSSTSTHSATEDTPNGGRLLQVYNSKRSNSNGGGLPILKKSISRNTLLLNNNPSPNRPSFKTPPPPTSQPEKQLTVETAIFPPELPIFQEGATRRSASSPAVITSGGGDAKNNMLSGSESTRSNNKRLQKKKASNANVAASFINPTDIFAQNLSDAVMDADDSDDLESYVYRDKPHSNANYNISPWSYNNDEYHDRHYYSSTGTESNTDGCESAYNSNREKYSTRRPLLRSTVSEIPRHHMRNQKKFNSRPSYNKNYYNNHPSEDEEFTPLIRSRPPRRRKGSSSHHSGSGGKQSQTRRTFFTFLYVIGGCLLALCVLWIIIVIYASPLEDVEVVGISNVLGTQKELIFNLQVRARNRNWWTIRMTNTAFSVFASSHYVPTAMMLMSLDNTTIPNITLIEDYRNSFGSLGADPAEFLGTIYHLEDPLIYQSGRLFQPETSTATSQIQIKNPGSTKDDNSGNERWSLLIRYPYELTVRGVLKYQILPYLPTLTQLHSVRVCKMSRIDPATGKISDNVPLPEKSICDDPSPVEGSTF